MKYLVTGFALISVALIRATPIEREIVPKVITVALMNDVKEKFSIVEGIYILASTKVNGKPHWLQEGGTDAIWFDPVFNNWKLGSQSILGNAFGSKILTTKDSAEEMLPNEISPWLYTVKGTWTYSDDIVVEGSSSPIETTTPLTPLPVTTTTKEPTFQCQYYEIPLELRCDGIPHCMPENEDEQNCPEGPSSPIATNTTSLPVTITTEKPEAGNGKLCYVSNGNQKLEDLNQNKEKSEHNKHCISKTSACFALSGEEYGQNGCLEGDIRQLHIFKDFLEWNEQKPYPIKQDFTKGDIKINYKLAGVQLNVMISADKTIFQQEPRETEAEIVIKSEDLAFKMKLSGFDLSAIERLSASNKSFEEILDSPDVIPYVEQSFVGDLQAAYKKIKPFAKWIFKGHQWSAYEGEDINMEIKINLSHGAENSADLALKAEITEAVSTFLSKRFAETLNANMEFCTEGKKCKKMKICDGDLCNSI